jgi:hypothetical protein
MLCRGGDSIEKLMLYQPVKKFDVLYGTENLLPCSQESAIGHFPEPVESTAHIIAYLLKAS